MDGGAPTGRDPSDTHQPMDVAKRINGTISSRLLGERTHPKAQNESGGNVALICATFFERVVPRSEAAVDRILE